MVTAKLPPPPAAPEHVVLAARLRLLADKMRRGFAAPEEIDLCRVLLGTLGE